MTVSKSIQNVAQQALGWSAYCAAAQMLADEAERLSAHKITSSIKQDLRDADERH